MSKNNHADDEDRDEFMDEAEHIHQAVAIQDMIVHCQLETVPLPKSDFILRFAKSYDLKQAEKKQIMKILTHNMEDLYVNAGWGWESSSKQKEVFHITSRFLYLTGKDDQIIGYVMFRFEWDDEEEPEHPVVFLYELQILSEYHKNGIGKYLMNLLSKVSNTCRMWKILLTCFKENTAAMSFYRSIGYNIDVNSPSRCGHEDETYEILSNKPNLK
jgi:ribosomal protein S18 acetylase RimI-like enzyme